MFDKSKNIWFTADWHLGHNNIIKYCDRPFKSTLQMKRKLIKNYNSVVGKNDIVIVVGDVSLHPANYLSWYINVINKFNGEKHLIFGNHDILNPFQYITAGFVSAHTSLIIDDYIIVHDPSVSQIDRNKKFICGHVHNMFTKHKNVVNIGVDVWDYKPVHFDTVKRMFEEE